MNKVSTNMEKTEGDLIAPGDDTAAYYVLPEEALQFLPEEWRNHFQAMAGPETKSNARKAQIFRLFSRLWGTPAKRPTAWLATQC
jgi:hypothetical protein